MYIIFYLAICIASCCFVWRKELQEFVHLTGIDFCQHLPTQKKCLTSHPNVDHQDRSRSLNISDSLL